LVYNWYVKTHTAREIVTSAKSGFVVEVSNPFEHRFFI